MALVTQADDPTTWAALYAKWTAEGMQGWVLYDSMHYKVSWDTSGTVQFSSYTTRELVDSRSLTKSKGASYKDSELE